MPRAAVTDTQKKLAAVTGTITQYMTLRRVSEQYMADQIGVTKETFRKKMKNSGKFTVEQLVMMTNILQIPQDVNLLVGARRENTEETFKALIEIIKGVQ